jgi:hypothetical protein
MIDSQINNCETEKVKAANMNVDLRHTLSIALVWFMYLNCMKITPLYHSFPLTFFCVKSPIRKTIAGVPDVDGDR